jgi:deoxyribodipyrimidine photolyase-related protein
MSVRVAPGGTLVVILGDQLSPELPALAGADRARSVVLMCEVAEETAYVPHHRKKIAFVLSAMRHYAQELRGAGWRVDYVALDDPSNTGSFTGEVRRALARHRATAVRSTAASEWRVREMQRGWAAALGVPVDILPDTRFACSPEAFADWAAGRRQLRMEYFYREMRRRTGLLMDGAAPAGGRWNFDAENRKPAASGTRFDGPPRFAPDAVTRAVLALVGERFPDNVGALEGFGFAVTRAQARQALDHFLAASLPRFGETQDAMLAGEPFLNHAVLSPYLNVGLLDPLPVCRAAESEYRAGRAPLAAVEGFVRQVLGWREFVRGIYWREMPGYETRNALGARRPLPAFYWTGDTDMACLRAALGQTLEHAYAHHIQRLMVTGNFAMLAGVDPHALHLWYLSVYADAFEWVELPNTLGMSQYADGGLLASKPYAASGAYLKRMSDYCGGCRYKVAHKTGPQACPFNALYWDFLARHEGLLARNPRMAPMLRAWNRFDEAQKAAYRASAGRFLATLDRPPVPG